MNMDTYIVDWMQTFYSVKLFKFLEKEAILIWKLFVKFKLYEYCNDITINNLVLICAKNNFTFCDDHIITNLI